MHRAQGEVTTAKGSPQGWGHCCKHPPPRASTGTHVPRTWQRCRAAGRAGRAAGCSQGCPCSPCRGCRGSQSSSRSLRDKQGGQRGQGDHRALSPSPLALPLPRELGWWRPWCPRCHLPAGKPQNIISEVTQLWPPPALTHEVPAALGALIKLQERLLVCAGRGSRMPSIFAENPEKTHKVSHACAKRPFPALKGSFMCLCSEQTASQPLPSSQLHPMTPDTHLLPPNAPIQEGELQKLGGNGGTEGFSASTTEGAAGAKGLCRLKGDPQ